MTDYRIEYTIQRREDDEADFTEIGFGQSGEHEDVDGAIWAISTDLETRRWETGPGMPDPDTIGKDAED